VPRAARVDGTIGQSAAVAGAARNPLEAGACSGRSPSQVPGGPPRSHAKDGPSARVRGRVHTLKYDRRVYPQVWSCRRFSAGAGGLERHRPVPTCPRRGNSRSRSTITTQTASGGRVMSVPVSRRPGTVTSTNCGEAIANVVSTSAEASRRGRTARRLAGLCGCSIGSSCATLGEPSPSSPGPAPPP
jgi:hypothetical protein